MDSESDLLAVIKETSKVIDHDWVENNACRPFNSIYFVTHLDLFCPQNAPNQMHLTIVSFRKKSL